jgi:FkbM family methyltransferase
MEHVFASEDVPKAARTSGDGKRLGRRMAGRLASVLDRMGWPGVAGRVRGRATRGRIVAVTVPPGPGDDPARAFAMYEREGADQVARALGEAGWRGFEWPMPAVFAAMVRARAGLVFDIGANTGFYSLLGACLGDGVVTHAFEPFPPVAAMLRENVDLNACGDRVVLVDAAVAAAPGTATLYVPPGDHGLVQTSCSLEPRFHPVHATSFPVRVVSVDGYWMALGRPAVAVLKVDVEGGEHDVLTGASELLAVERPFVFYELLPNGQAAVIDAIRTAGDFVDVRLWPDRAVVGDRVRFDAAAWNHLMVPAERLTEALDLLKAAGLPWVPAADNSVSYFDHSTAGRQLEPWLGLAVNQDRFRPGETLIVTAVPAAGGGWATRRPAERGNDPAFDLYVVVDFPDGTTFSLQPGGAVVPGIAPMSTGLRRFDSPVAILRRTFTGGEPGGFYRLFGLLTEHGTLRVVGEVSRQSLTFTP